ncbi:hypothetical protein PLICRDRAFT_211071 [Plicaturopsis crispa FD-325 SS-3]|nr:hypothetical protein PLICRDRAFT_211071 [Plicaturopsis crispa FD-325 SS-3]
MRPRAIHTEDSQPNEIRLARKGNERVPTVRSSRGGFRGAPQVRGRPPYHSTNHQQRPQNHNYYQGRNNTTQHNFQRPHKHFTDIPPRAADSFKRPRFDNLNGSRGGERPSSNTHSHASSSAQMNKASRQIQIVAELPDTCWRGVFGSHNAREEWLRIEIPRIEQTRHVSVYGHFFMDRMVRFNCYTGPDDSNRTEEIRNGDAGFHYASCIYVNEKNV